jgi:hypothetical protein
MSDFGSGPGGTGGSGGMGGTGGPGGAGGTTALLTGEAPSPPARAEAWSRPAARRKARQVFRPRRTVPGVLVAAVLAAAGILGAIWAVSAALSRPVWTVSHGDFGGPLQNSVRWADTGTLTVASAAAFVGFVLILIGVIPGRARALPLASGDTSVVIGVSRRNLHRSLRWLVEDVAGVDSAKVRTRRHTVKVRATTRLRDTAGLREKTQSVVQDRLAALDPLFPLDVKVKLRRKKG